MWLIQNARYTDDRKPEYLKYITYRMISTMTAYHESIIVTKTIVNFNNTDKTAFTNIELSLQTNRRRLHG